MINGINTAVTAPRSIELLAPRTSAVENSNYLQSTRKVAIIFKAALAFDKVSVS